MSIAQDARIVVWPVCHAKGDLMLLDERNFECKTIREASDISLLGIITETSQDDPELPLRLWGVLIIFCTPGFKVYVRDLISGEGWSPLSNESYPKAWEIACRHLSDPSIEKNEDYCLACEVTLIEYLREGGKGGSLVFPSA